MTPDEVFRSYVRIIGVGGIAGAGIMGVLSGLPGMVRSVAANMRSLGHQDTREAKAVPRVDRTLSTTFVAVGLVIAAVLCLLFFSFGLGLETALGAAAVATLVVMAIAFLFAPVAARAIAIVGTNPISGMTMLTLILTGMVLLKLGLSGGRGMFLTMMVGGVVCTALSVSGGFATDLKVGHWLGATPAKADGAEVLRHLRGVGRLRRGHVRPRQAAGRLRQRGHPSAPGQRHEGHPDRHLRHRFVGAAVVPLRSGRAPEPAACACAPSPRWRSRSACTSPST